MTAAAKTGRTAMQSRTEGVRKMNLRQLLAGFTAVVPADVEITDLTLDSRAIRPGMAFIALPGTRAHGVGFAAQAVAAGARAVVWEPVAGVAAPVLAQDVAAHRRAGSDSASRRHCRPLLCRTFTGGSHRRRHRHERQDDDGSCHRGSVASAWRSIGVCRYAGLRSHRGAADRDAHDARQHHRASSARRAARRRWALSGHGSLIACARPASRRRRPFRHRRVHQSHARSSGLSRHARSVRRGEGEAVRVAGVAACGHQRR